MPACCALSPYHLLATVRALWPAYAATVLLILAVANLASLARALGMPGLIVDALGLYSMYFTMHLTGRLLYLHRDDIGLNVSTMDTQRDAERERDVQTARGAMLDMAYQKARNADVTAAIAVVTGWLGTDGNDTAINRAWLLGRMQSWPDPRLALAMTPAVVERQLRDGQPLLALDAASWAVARNPKFRLRTAEATLALSQAARRHGNFRLLTSLLDCFIERYPDSAHAPAATLLAARIALEKTGETDLARRNLTLLDTHAAMRDNVTYRRLRELV